MNIHKLALLATVSLSLTGCGYASPDAGQEGVAIRKPWFFGSGGVAEEPIQTGSTIVAASTDVVYVDVTPQAFEIKFNDLAPSDGIPLDFQTTVRLQVTNSVELVKSWNGAATNEKGEPAYSWFWRNIEPQYQNFVRQAVKRYTMNDLALTGAAIDAVDQEVQKRLQAYLAEIKIPVRLLGVTVGRANPPSEILAQRTQTAAQQQRVKTMEEAKKAEDARKAAEQARAEADNAYRQQMSLTPEQFVDLKRIEMQEKACQRSTCIFGNAQPIVGR